jgi:hypothetical protein
LTPGQGGASAGAAGGKGGRKGRKSAAATTSGKDKPSAHAAHALLPPDVWAVDGALPAPLLAAAKEFLKPDSAFWAEHDYSIHGVSRPYFSYL